MMQKKVASAKRSEIRQIGRTLGRKAPQSLKPERGKAKDHAARSNIEQSNHSIDDAEPALPQVAIRIGLTQRPCQRIGNHSPSLAHRQRWPGGLNARCLMFHFSVDRGVDNENDDRNAGPHH